MHTGTKTTYDMDALEGPWEPVKDAMIHFHGIITVDPVVFLASRSR